MELKLKRIQFTTEVERIAGVFLKMFPEEQYHVKDCMDAFKDSVAGNDIDRQLDYYMVEDTDGVLIGVTGIYAQNNDEAWLGWFGILPEYRNKGIGYKVLMKTLELMKAFGDTIVRLYTDPVADAKAVELYKNVGFVQDSKYDDWTITMKYDLIGSGCYNTMIPDWKGKPYGM